MRWLLTGHGVSQPVQLTFLLTSSFFRRFSKTISAMYRSFQVTCGKSMTMLLKMVVLKMFFLVLDLLFVMKNIFVSISTFKNVQRQNSRNKKIWWHGKKWASRNRLWPRTNIPAYFLSFKYFAKRVKRMCTSSLLFSAWGVLFECSLVRLNEQFFRNNNETLSRH